MAGRSATAAVLSEAAASKNRPVHLYEFYFDSVTSYATDAYRNLVWNGNTYAALGGVLDFTGVRETADLQVSEATITRAGVDQLLIATVLTESVLDRQVKIYKAFLDASENVMTDPVLIFDGRMDAPVITEDAPEDLTGASKATSTVSVNATSHFVDFERRPGRHTNHQEQQIYFPGDRGFEFVSEIQKQIVWGRPG